MSNLPQPQHKPTSLARRLAPAAALGGVAVAIVGLLDPALSARSPGSAEAAAATEPAASAVPEASAPSAPPTASSQDSQAQPGSPDDWTPVATESAAPGSAAVPPAAAATASCDNGQNVTGPAVEIPWGEVTVAATVANGQVCEVHAVAYPKDDDHSSRINSRAIPALDEAATSSGVAFDNISGATYTSQAYRESLQGILDQL